jgi:Na+/H+ antiporter NhaD/arsenite permease-like protein
VLSGRANHLAETAGDYLSFIATLGALFVAAGGVYATADLEATPSTNVGFVLAGSLLASFIGRALAALSRGLSAGQADLVAGITPLKLAAISTGSVVMGAMTYIGNGPNLMVKTIAEKRATPSLASCASRPSPSRRCCRHTW